MMDDDIEKMSDKQLYEKAHELGIKCCPITPQTRRIILNRIKKILIKDTLLDKNNNPVLNLSTEIYNSCLPTPSIGDIANDNDLNNLSCDLSELKLHSTPNQSKLSSSTTKYYAVQSPQNFVIAHSLKEIATLGKSDPNLRFKTFCNYLEAETYVKSFQMSILSDSNDNHHLLNDSKHSINDSIPDLGQLPTFKPWKSISTSFIIKFRKYIERGDKKNVLLHCLENPRYLISSTDNPVILHEGTRRNAFHIAAEKNQHQLIELFLYLLRNDMWCQACHLVPNTDNDTLEDILKNNNYKKYAGYTIDCYLNTPDKTMFETPLHIACKYGSMKVVEIFLKQPEINVNSKNKFGKRPYDLIGTRCGINVDPCIQAIKNLFINYSKQGCTT